MRSDVLNISSLDLLVYLLFHLFLFWLSNNNAKLYRSFSLISVAPLCLFSKTLEMFVQCCVLLKVLDMFFIASIVSKQVLSSVVNTS